jgi:hypothetical protein
MMKIYWRINVVWLTKNIQTLTSTCRKVQRSVPQRSQILKGSEVLCAFSANASLKTCKIHTP